MLVSPLSAFVVLLSIGDQPVDRTWGGQAGLGSGARLGLSWPGGSCVMGWGAGSTPGQGGKSLERERSQRNGAWT